MNTPEFDLCQFADRHQHPVHAELNGDGEFDSSNISFEDYSRMQTQEHKASGQRRLPTPEWALDPKKLCSVIARYFELRAGFRFPQPGTDLERLQRAQARLLAEKPRKVAVLDKLCAEYVEVKRHGADFARLRRLGIEIEGLDTQLVLIDRGPAFVVALVYFYYSLRLDSVGVSQQLGGSPKPCAIRQLLFRLARTWDAVKGVRSARRCRDPRVRVRKKEKTGR